MVERKLFTSESVTEGHPDKLCDQLSDAILDAIIKEDPLARVACETACTTGLVIAMGEITTTAYADIQHIVREVVEDIGYVSSDMGFDANTCAVLSSIHEQSPDISRGVDQALEARGGHQTELGAGDQGMMFGYACDQTPVLMPLGCVLAHNLAKQLTAVRKAGTLPYLRPDGKSQVSIVMEGDVPKYVDGVVVSSQHDPDVTQEQLRQDILDKVIRPVLPANLWDEQTKLWVNPTGRFVVGGPHGDSGLTGRKIIVDTYGGYARHGGGAFSGKDPTKVDRSGAYMARYIAKNLVAAGLAKRLEMQISYAIGVAQPVSINVEAFGSSKYSNEQLQACVRKTFDMRPGAIIERLQLRRPIYRQTAAYGHFGRADLQLPWEQVDQVEAVRKNIE